MKLLFWIVVFAVAAALALFAASNRESVSLALWPLPFVVELQLYLAILGALLIGFFAGAVASRIASRRRRRDARRQGRRLAIVERELAATRAQLHAAGETPLARLPARG